MANPKRPRDVNQRAALIVGIATGKIVEKGIADSPAASLGRKGGAARAAAMTPAERQRIARKAAETRWGASARQGKKEPQGRPD